MSEGPHFACEQWVSTSSELKGATCGLIDGLWVFEMEGCVPGSLETVWIGEDDD